MSLSAPKSTAHKFIFRSVLLKTRIQTDWQKQTKALRPGSVADHIVELGIHYAHWPLQLSVESKLSDTRQLSFGSGTDSWHFDRELLPNESAGEFRSLLKCSENKVRPQEKIAVKAKCYEGSEQITIEVRIE